MSILTASKNIKDKIKQDELLNTTEFNTLINEEIKRNMNNIKQCNNSWLSANPSCDNNAILTKEEFKIPLCLRSELNMPNLPKKCYGHGE